MSDTIDAALRHLCGAKLQPLLLRQICFADLKHVLALEQRAYPQPWSEGNFRDCLAAPHYDNWGVWHDTCLVAYGVMALQFDEMHLLNVCVDVPCQRQGIGKQLLLFLLARAQVLGAASMLLEVRASNERALALYRCLGFEMIGWRKRYYRTASGREDAKVLRCDLGA